MVLSPAGLGAESEVRSGLSPAASPSPHHLPVTAPLTVFPRGANFSILSQACAIFGRAQLECPAAPGETPTSARHLGGSAGFTAGDQTCLHISVTGNKGTNPCHSVSWCFCLGIKGHKRWLRPERGGLPNSNKPSSSSLPVQKKLAPVLLPPDLWDWTSVMLEVQEPLATRRTKHRPRKTEQKDSRSCVPGAAAGLPGSRASGPGPCAGATGQSCS